MFGQILDYSIPYQVSRWGGSIASTWNDGKPIKFHHCPMCKSIQFDHVKGTSYDSPLLSAWAHGSRCRECGWWSMETHHMEEDSFYSNHEQTIGELITYNIDSIEVPVAAVLRHLNRQFDDVAFIHPRKFEELVATIFREHLDCSVELTKQTRDGGKDIICFNSDKGKFYVELKRHKKTNKVGISVIQRFVGVLYQDRITNGLIVTSSTFTKDAMEAAILANHTHEVLKLELHDATDLLSWLNAFQEEVDSFHLVASQKFAEYSFEPDKRPF